MGLITNSHNQFNESCTVAEKVTVALAVLRLKPPEISGRDFAASLSLKWQTSQSYWKLQYEIAETEILQLKQELNLQKQLQLTGLTVENQTVLVTKTPPETLVGHSNTRSCVAHKHVEFLQNLINIQTGSRSSNIQTGSRSSNIQTGSRSSNIQTGSRSSNIQNGSMSGNSQEDRESTEQRLLHSIEVLQNHIADRSISWEMKEQCLHSIAKLSSRSDKALGCTIKGKLLEMCFSGIERLISCSHQKYEVHRIESLISAMFNESEQTFVEEFQLLCDMILDYSSVLRKCVEQKITPHPNKYCCSFYIIRAMEHCLSKTGAISVEEKSVCRTKLEECLLHVTEKFPLFGHAVWRIIGKIS